MEIYAGDYVDHPKFVNVITALLAMASKPHFSKVAIKSESQAAKIKRQGQNDQNPAETKKPKGEGDTETDIKK